MRYRIHINLWMRVSNLHACMTFWIVVNLWTFLRYSYWMYIFEWMLALSVVNTLYSNCVVFTWLKTLYTISNVYTSIKHVVQTAQLNIERLLTWWNRNRNLFYTRTNDGRPNICCLILRACVRMYKCVSFQRKCRMLATDFLFIYAYLIYLF